MLQTSKNQLNPDQIILQKRQLIIDELTKAGYSNNITDKHNTGKKYIINTNDSLIHVGLTFFRYTKHQVDVAYLIKELEIGAVLCNDFTNEDISAVTKLYIYMLKNNIKAIPDVIIKRHDTIVQPGQFAEIISEYFYKDTN